MPYQNSVSEDGVKAGVVFGDFDWRTDQPAEQPEFPPQMSLPGDEEGTDSDKMATA
jgi:hypothetical protein